MSELKADEIYQRLHTVEAEQSDLENQRGDIVLDRLNGRPDADQRIAVLDAKIAVAKRDVDDLRAAHAAAIARERAKVLEAKAAIAKSQINAVRQHLAKRDRATADFTAAITETIKHWRTIQETSEKAMRACPVGFSWPHDSVCEPDALLKAVTYELYRLSANPGGKDMFPGSQLPNLDVQWQPQKIEPLLGKMQRARVHVMTALTGRNDEEAEASRVKADA